MSIFFFFWYGRVGRWKICVSGSNLFSQPSLSENYLKKCNYFYKGDNWISFTTFSFFSMMEKKVSSSSRCLFPPLCVLVLAGVCGVTLQGRALLFLASCRFYTFYRFLSFAFQTTSRRSSGATSQVESHYVSTSKGKKQITSLPTHINDEWMSGAFKFHPNPRGPFAHMCKHCLPVLS